MVRQGSTGGFRFISFREKVEEGIKAGLVRNLQEGIRIWQRALLQQMSGRRTGREYFIPGTKVKYRASSAVTNPPESPAVRTGVLRRSYRTEVSKEALTAYLGTELDYGLFMERGTVHIRPRKSLEPAFARVATEIAAALGREITN